MKKIFLLSCVAGILMLTSCGPSAEEKAKAEQATKDSVQAADDMRKAAEEAAAAAATVTADTAVVDTIQAK